ncbi:hypothetical protein H4R21_002468 [Coemansia helicoidea]|uniref:Uncharacterized protein n=1 Tax=Coemansia helicoidea TaxID=1286919 RepID=A0ACC1L7A7_9FUNG|nr:hypothetical protein H4R21_002468 [Coemansia helicoidea]
MGQYWNMFCIDNRQATGDLGKLGVVFYTNPHIAERKLLSRRAVHHPKPATRPVAPLERLPPHIKRRICAFLAAADVDGLLCTILAVPHLAADGRVALNRHISWAGKRIITLGDYADCVPKNLLTAEEESCLLDPTKRTNSIIDEDKFIDGKGAVMSRTYPRAHRYATLHPRSYWYMKPCNAVEQQFQADISWPDNAVLRNLTLKQYYRGDGRCQRKCCHDRKVGGLDTNFGLGQVMLIMTCWSDDTSTSFSGDWTEDDVHGEWAGHRLDIVALTRVPADWEDVTDAVKAKLMRLRDQPR